MVLFTNVIRVAHQAVVVVRQTTAMRPVAGSTIIIRMLVMDVSIMTTAVTLSTDIVVVTHQTVVVIRHHPAMRHVACSTSGIRMPVMDILELTTSITCSISYPFG